MSVKIALKDFPLWLRQRMRLNPEAAQKGLLAAAMRSVGVLQDATRNATPGNPSGLGIGAVDTGRLVASWRAAQITNGARVYNTSPYAGIVEYGRRPGKFPNITAIARWAQRRLGLSKEEAARAAWPIAEAIARRGLAPRRVLANSLGQIKKLAIEEIKKALSGSWSSR